MDIPVAIQWFVRVAGPRAVRGMGQHITYRPYIDGLRALAVLSVLGFHAFPREVTGGFIGVDIFFVISGFLISSIIYGALRKDDFNYVEFYVRRIRRIFPALLIVLGTCLVAGWFVLLPQDYKQLGRQIAAGAGFSSNILLWTQAGYFDTGAAVKPLLHLWSLGIEEQFYLLWPLLIAFLFRRTRHLALIIAALLLSSFACNLAFVHRDPSATFYLPMTRLWELLGGALLAYLTMFHGGDSIAQPQAADASQYHGVDLRGEALAWAGVLLIAAALLFIDKNTEFPGWWALLPTVGTLLIIAARHAWLNRVILSNRVLVFVGLISYPLYLWHWVLLAFMRIRLYHDGAEAPRSERIAALVLSFLLAWLTYMLIENPLRFGARPARKALVLLLLMGVIGISGLAVDRSDGAALRYPPQIRPLAGFDYDSERERYDAEYAGRGCFIDALDRSFADLGAQCIEPPDGRRRLLVLWGDSHAASLYSGLKAIQGEGADFRIAQFTMAACPPILEHTFARRIACRPFNDAAFARIKALKPDIVVLEATWWWYSDASPEADRLNLAALQATVRRLSLAGVSRVVVFGVLPQWEIAQPKVGMKLWVDTRSLPERTNAYLVAESERMDSLVREAVSTTRAVFVSPIDALCTERGCLLTTNRSTWTPVAWDAAHLTDAGSDYLIARTASSILGDRFRAKLARGSR
ncbi:MAG TPA: acyltransferase family protein [Steroidobacteraceae bacterium]